ncbi:HpcH/HpaI aldolase family protein [Cellulomonas aerilata]|uniref:2,4-dihydroxyhept-2-ene-1,7-dioic acid aldolase n=1 Tax=Cellulomonas aerilata TaxID=515326 RepID=A0A512DBJ5_9CELL|nr:aldolase/citrate lyase family protein [Cellulomonas aerilata]GEO33858.1 2,4-dihydroxyhept-2-ene-1,7-dioic acid aldolase [Cellulomonas aerilata]
MTDETTAPAPEPLHLGAWSMLGSTAAASIMAGVGADWLLLDAQHGLYDDRGVVDALGALAGPPRPGRTSQVLVRVPSNDDAWIGRALDAGASGVMVPMVEDEADAARAARSCRYPPHGRRSRGSWVEVWGTPTPSPRAADDAVMCAVMVETRQALERVTAIARTPGVDMVFVGPYDLSLALGVEHAALLADESPDGPLRRVVAACRAAGVPAGAYAGGLDAAQVLARHGFTWIAVAIDTVVLPAAAASLVSAARDA